MIAYDTNVLIYALEGHSEFGDAAKRILHLGETEGAALSILASQELFTGMVLASKDKVDTVFALGLLKSTKFYVADERVVGLAVELSAKYGRKCVNYDAVLLATAIVHGAKVFYTNDYILLNTGITEIKVLGLV
jgi:predicted nucleic acid-binding protein